MAALAAKFKGTKNYHNYTKKANPHAKANKRYIIDMKVEQLSQEQLNEYYGEEVKNGWIKVTLLGQSFIYHQIRKMMGMMIQTMQENLDESFMENSFCTNKMPVWLAPGEGLLLDRLNFDAYNKKKDIPEPIVLNDEMEASIEAFKNENIYKCILAYEEKDSVFTNWCLMMNEAGDGL